MRVRKQSFILAPFLILFFTSRFWGTNIPWMIVHLSQIAGIIYLFSRPSKSAIEKSCAQYQMNLALYSYLAIAVFSVFLIFLSSTDGGINNIRTLTISTVYLIIPIMFAYQFIRVDGEDCIGITFNVAVFSYVLGSVVPLVVNYGFEGISYLLTLNSNSLHINFMMEVHDLTFAFGCYFLYFLCFEEKGRKRTAHLLICILMLYWGLKRIEIAALFVCWLIYWILCKKERNIKLVISVVSICIIATTFLYIAMIHDGRLIELANMYGIEFSGRLDSYDYIASNYSRLSLDYVGNGFKYTDNLVDQLIESNVKVGYTTIVRGLHCDVLKMYIDLGFVGFFVWIVYQTNIRARLIYRRFSSKATIGYILINLYLFILYLTDNCYGYPRTNFVAVLVLMVISCKDSYKNSYIDEL